ncbi:MAG: 23S rRNA (guanosine(2251)-2'-O)-methyltransferase RlmB [Acidimicrobiia bacterium]
MGGRAVRKGVNPRGGRREGLGGEQIEGRRAVLELLHAQTRPVREVLLARGETDDEIEALAFEAGARVRHVSEVQLEAEARSAAPQGVIAYAAPLAEADADELLNDPAAFLVALDGVTDPGNFGAILRTAESAGATGVIVPKQRSARVTPTVAKAAAGAIEHLPLAPVPGIPAFLERAKRAGVWSVGLDERGESSLFDLSLADAPLVIVMGAEGRGLAALTKKRCDLLVNIPMRGHVESLNVSAAAALACFEVARRRLG